ncbi:MAG: dephospho-CoA kinase [Lentisphaeria bacterium]|nr:dephospho-CoA kinase [Lentisphaeria bacterium]
MIIGITGGFGCGKSTVLKLFERAGAAVYSADSLCHEIYEAKDTDFFNAIKKYFGADAINPDGSANRKFIASKVFSNPADMDFLNKLFQQPLKEKIYSKIQNAKNSSAMTAIEIPLLFEGHYENLVDKTITIYAPPEARKNFLAKRGFSPDEMQKRDAFQMSLDEKTKLADFVIINGSTEEFLEEQFNNIYNILTR